jgi:ribosome biogenesis protein UTP30
VKGELIRAISSTYMHQNLGTCTYGIFSSPTFFNDILFSSIKIGVLSQTPSQIIANLKSALPAVVSHIKGGWDNVQSFHIKTNSSASLPIWTCSLGEGENGRWAGLGADKELAGEYEEGSDINIDELFAKETATTKAIASMKLSATPPGTAKKRKASSLDDSLPTRSSDAPPYDSSDLPPKKKHCRPENAATNALTISSSSDSAHKRRMERLGKPASASLPSANPLLAKQNRVLAAASRLTKMPSSAEASILSEKLPGKKSKSKSPSSLSSDATAPPLASRGS